MLVNISFLLLTLVKQYLIYYIINFQKSSVKLPSSITHRCHVFRWTEESAAVETMFNDNEEISISTHWILPSRGFQGIWENLHYDLNIKENVSSKHV